MAATLYSMKQNIKHVIVVDEDVDPYDFQQVFFAMTSRVDASRDVQILNVMRHVNDPGGEGRTVGGMIIDATRPRDSEEFEIAKPSAAALEKARKALDTRYRRVHSQSLRVELVENHMSLFANKYFACALGLVLLLCVGAGGAVSR